MATGNVSGAGGNYDYTEYTTTTEPVEEVTTTESTDESASAEGASETQGSESTDGSTSTDGSSGSSSSSAAQDTTSIFSTQTEGYQDTTYGDGTGVQSNSDINSKGIEDVLNEGGSSEFATLSKEDQEAYLEAYGLASETGEIEGYTYTTNDKGEGYYVSDDGTEFIKVIGEENGTNAKVVHTTANDDGTGSTEIYDMGVSQNSRKLAEDLSKATSGNEITSLLSGLDSSTVTGALKAFNSTYGDVSEKLGDDTVAIALVDASLDGNLDAEAMLNDYVLNNKSLASTVGNTLLENINSEDNELSESSQELLYNLAVSENSSQILTNLSSYPNGSTNTNKLSSLVESATNYLLDSDNGVISEAGLSDSQVDFLSSTISFELKNGSNYDSLNTILNSETLYDEDKANVLLNYAEDNSAADLYAECSAESDKTDLINSVNNALVNVVNNANEANPEEVDAETIENITNMLAEGLDWTIDSGLSSEDKQTILNNLSNPEKVSTSTLVDIASAYNGDNNEKSLVDDIGDSDKYKNFVESYADALISCVNSEDTNEQEQAINLLCNEVYNAMDGLGTMDNFLEAVFDGDTSDDDFINAMSMLYDNYDDITGSHLYDDIENDYLAHSDTASTYQENALNAYKLIMSKNS